MGSASAERGALSRFEGDPSTWLPLARLNAYSFGKTARLMQRLADFGVLDSTLIYTSGSMGDPVLHSPADVPAVLAGGASGKFRMGRGIHLQEDCSSGLLCQNRGPDDARVFNNKLLVSIAQAFGVEIDRFGTQADGGITRGALCELG